MEPLAVKGALAAFNALVKFFTDLGNRETSNLLEAIEIDRRSHNAQVAQHVKVLMVEWSKLAKDAEELRAKIDEMAADSQFRRLHANLEYEAVRSTLDERKEMLAAAAAGLCNPRMSIEDKARVERTLRDLDPADILLLRRPFLRSGLHTMSILALLTTGCIRENPVRPDEYEQTRLGQMVLEVLRMYRRP